MNVEKKETIQRNRLMGFFPGENGENRDWHLKVGGFSSRWQKCSKIDCGDGYATLWIHQESLNFSIWVG
jgi:hypothetical protein